MTQPDIVFLAAFADAWNRHDIDALMQFMTDDCVFESSFGSQPCGTRYQGSAAVREGFSRAWLDYPDAQWLNARHFVAGSRGVSEWLFTGTRAADAKPIATHGCDIFTFRDGKICLKNSWRKIQI